MSATILLTGSSGTVGTALCQALAEEGHHVIPLDIKRSVWDSDIDRRTLRHDLRRPLTSVQLDDIPDLIIHLAANARVHESVDNPVLARDNYLMTYNVLEFARNRGVKRILFSSSREIYGEPRSNRQRPEWKTAPTEMKSPYTASKFGSEALLHAYHECYHIKPVIARLSNVYGRYDVSERVIPLFLYYALRNRDLTVFGAEKKLDFTYIDDCTGGLTRIAERFDRLTLTAFNICTGRGEKLTDMAKAIIRAVGSKSRILIGQKRLGEISAFVGDISAARKELGYCPRVTLNEGLPLAVDWYCRAMKSRNISQLQRRILKQRGWA